MSSLLLRKVAQRDKAKRTRADARKAEHLGRAVQLERSTIDVGDEPEPLLDVIAAPEEETDLDGVGLDELDQYQDAEDATHEAQSQSIETAVEMGQDIADAIHAVDAAQQEAQDALEQAANALTTSNGKNARRRGVTEPDPPPGGWVQGDQWVRDVIVEGVPKPTEVLVWDGTAFAHETLLTGEVFVIGPDGLVRIANGQVTADSMAASFYYGREFYGGLFEGGEFRLETVTAETQVLYDQCEVVGSWTAGVGGAACTRSSAYRRSGTYSIVAGAVGGARVASRPFTSTSFPRGGYVSAWVYSASAQSVFVGATGGFGRLRTVPAGTWTEVRAELPVGTWAGLSVEAQSTAALYVDDVRVVSYDAMSGTAGIGRSMGQAVVYSSSPAGPSAYLRDGALEVRASDVSITSFIQAYVEGNMARWGVSAGVNGVHLSSGMSAESGMSEEVGARVNIVSPTGSTRLEHGELWTDGPLLLQGSQIELDAPVKFQGDRDWVDLPYTTGHQTASLHGPLQMCRVGGIVYFRGGASKTSGTFATSETTIVPAGGVPEWARPSQHARFAAAGGQGAVGTLLIHTDGRVIVNSNTAAAWWAGMISYPAAGS